jgi:hypothetical protein
VADQLDLFGAPPPKPSRRNRQAEDGEAVAYCERVRRDELARAREALRAPPPCPHHGPEHVCEREGLDTDHSGFVHRSLCKGRIPLRWCAQCGKPTTPGRWNHADWSRCIECAPLGTVSGRQLLMEQSRSLTNNRQSHS